MNNIFEQLLYTTLRIECTDANKCIYIGTGFLLERPVNNGSKIYLVSNKHVLCNAEKIVISFTKSIDGIADTGNIVNIPIDNVKSNVHGHPDASVDVAVLECTGLFIMTNNTLYFKAVAYDMLASFNEPELAVSETVYFIGYPNNNYDIKNNLPLVRTGIIASHPKLDYNGNPVFIIDAQVFPGSSGSPVYIDLTYENFKNGQIELGKKNIKLLGIVSATMVRDNMLQTVPADTKQVTQEVLGLGIVYKANTIKQLVDSMPINN